MSHERSLADRRAEIDRHLETVLKSADRDCLELARATMEEWDDRWYGQLLALSYDSMADTSNTETVHLAATAIELLRGYCRLRSELLVQLNDEIAHSLTRDPTSALLASDYQHTSAYSTLGDVDHAHLRDCFEIFTNVSETIIEAFSTNYTQSSPTIGHCSFIDDTAGILGEGAALIGATLADVDRSRREHFAILGRGFSMGRQIQLSLNSGYRIVHIVPPLPDEQQLRQYAEQHLEMSNQALQDLSSYADVDPLRAFGKDTVSESSAD